MDQAETNLKPNILIAPLDWGLGHATRCIPIIHSLIQKNCNVLIACEGPVKALLNQEFPELRFIDLRGYRIQYSKNSRAFSLQIGKQIPTILSTIQYENERLKEIVKEHAIQGVISDNRYGFYHKSIPSVFITHQLRIKTPFGKLADDLLQYLNYKYINRFSQCWIPDNEGHPCLAGELSHPEKMPSIPSKYLGLLSRFKEKEHDQKTHPLILLSGPEPQRTIFERILIEQLSDYDGPVVFVRGLPGGDHTITLPSNIDVYNHLTAGELNQKMIEASVVVGRCGYSTVMDLTRLRKKSILIPTPGQSEQLYLAKHLMKNNLALCIDQDKFMLKNSLELWSHFNWKIGNFPLQDHLESVLEDFIAMATKQ